MAADKVEFFYLPYSAQLSLKKTFAKHFSDDSINVDEIKTEEVDMSQQVKIKQLEIRLQESDKENLNLTNINEENQEEIDNLKTKCKTFENNLK